MRGNSSLPLVRAFLGHKKKKKYTQITKCLLQNYQKLGSKISLRIHSLYSHVSYFPEHLGALIDKQGKWFRQNIASSSTMERRIRLWWRITAPFSAGR
jgi:hypothetical protein